MASTRRRGGENSAVRAALIDAAEELILEEGYPSVTSRTLADKLELKRQIVHYYFHTIDDVFIAVIRRNAERMRARVQEAEKSDEPLRALQRLCRDPDQAILSTELHALAHRRPAVRSEVSRYTSELRAQQTRMLSQLLGDQGIEPAMRPIVATVLLTSLAQTLAVEAAIDVKSGHKDTQQFIDACLEAFAEGRASPFMPTVKAAQIRPAARKAKGRKTSA